MTSIQFQISTFTFESNEIVFFQNQNLLPNRIHAGVKHSGESFLALFTSGETR
jgi:hypothetical protein